MVGVLGGVGRDIWTLPGEKAACRGLGACTRMEAGGRVFRPLFPVLTFELLLLAATLAVALFGMPINAGTSPAANPEFRV